MQGLVPKRANSLCSPCSPTTNTPISVQHDGNGTTWAPQQQPEPAAATYRTVYPCRPTNMEMRPSPATLRRTSSYDTFHFTPRNAREAPARIPVLPSVPSPFCP
ncbi:hypothetical protein PLESTB_000705300 [Pleodorina starrii]|uniref:Uncharacterized protein n=1 Tax=Pleodorina starrii TaxID=330485 RepID=A0A9W6BK62_9CHLO|nr:hypothetical protein PLESTB_000049900 [Pleodorina starrii]GLC53077.1 hypothetical protein PLESTB_000705300 [Pleodorina starrii]